MSLGRGIVQRGIVSALVRNAHLSTHQMAARVYSVKEDALTHSQLNGTYRAIRALVRDRVIKKSGFQSYSGWTTWTLAGPRDIKRGRKIAKANRLSLVE